MEFSRVDDIISKPTQTSGRALIAVSSIAVFAQVSGIRLSQIGIFKDIGTTELHLAVATTIAIWFLSATHLSNWTVDHRAYLASPLEQELNKAWVEHLDKELPRRGSLGLLKAEIEILREKEKTTDIKNDERRHAIWLADLTDAARSNRILLEIIHLRIPLICAATAIFTFFLNAILHKFGAHLSSFVSASNSVT